MFDTDGNQRVDKDEFLVVSIIIKLEYGWHFSGEFHVNHVIPEIAIQWFQLDE